MNLLPDVEDVDDWIEDAECRKAVDGGDAWIDVPFGDGALRGEHVVALSTCRSCPSLGGCAARDYPDITGLPARFQMIIAGRLRVFAAQSNSAKFTCQGCRGRVYSTTGDGLCLTCAVNAAELEEAV